MKNLNVKQQNLKYEKQGGGTFLGLIIGLIFGLGIAVVVALMITKSPIPFVNKVTKQERTELSPSQAADPNKPLYGNRDSAKEAAKDQAKAPDQPPAEVKKPDVAPVAPPAPVVKAPEAKPATPAKDPAGAKTDSGDEKWTYFLQTGAFREQSDAESARAKLALLGFEAKVSERPSDNGTLYRVRIGPLAQVETMNRIRSKLSDNGVDAAIVRVPK